MTKVAAIVWAGSVLGVLAAGCGSSSSDDPFGASPDFASIQQEFQHPSGTFTGKESQTFSSYADRKSNSSSALSGFSLGSGTSAAKAQDHLNLRLQSGGIHLDSGVACNFSGEGGSCTCPGGGSIQYDLAGFRQYANVQQKGGRIDATIRYKANACTNAAGESIDGTLFENYRGTVPPAGTAPSGPTDFAIIVDAHMTSVTKTGTTHVDVDFELSTSNGQYTEVFSVTVDDGNVTVSGSWDPTSKTGTITVTDKNGTTTCTASDGKTASCKGPDGASRTVNL